MKKNYKIFKIIHNQQYVNVNLHIVILMVSQSKIKLKIKTIAKNIIYSQKFKTLNYIMTTNLKILNQSQLRTPNQRIARCKKRKD